MKTTAAVFLAFQLAGLAAFTGGIAGRVSAAQSDRISLAGQWRFQLDRGNAGIQEQWFERSLPDKMRR